MEPMENSPASHAGLRAGQVIVKVDGQSMADFTIDQIAERIMGPIGTRHLSMSRRLRDRRRRPRGRAEPR